MSNSKENNKCSYIASPPYALIVCTRATLLCEVSAHHFRYNADNLLTRCKCMNECVLGKRWFFLLLLLSGWCHMKWLIWKCLGKIWTQTFRREVCTFCHNSRTLSIYWYSVEYSSSIFFSCLLSNLEFVKRKYLHLKCKNSTQPYNPLMHATQYNIVKLISCGMFKHTTMYKNGKFTH